MATIVSETSFDKLIQSQFFIKYSSSNAFSMGQIWDYDFENITHANAVQSKI